MGDHAHVTTRSGHVKSPAGPPGGSDRGHGYHRGRMSTNPEPSARRSPVALPLFIAVGLACLVGGFFVGWLTRGDGGTAQVLPTVEAPAPATTTARTTTANPPAAPAELKPAQITLGILNATSVTGLAAQTAARAAGLGYPNPATGNAPTQTTPTVVYFRPGKRPAAQRVAKDLGYRTVTALPATGAIATAAPAGVDVIVVLGPG